MNEQALSAVEFGYHNRQCLFTHAANEYNTYSVRNESHAELDPAISCMGKV